MEPLNQISLSFTEEEIAEKQQVNAAREEQPVNVGVRIKALKQNAAPVEEMPKAEPRKVVEKNKKVKSTRGRKSIKQVEAEADLIEIPEDDVLFQKQYYSMGEVAEMFRVNHSLLRFWENEFDIIQPRKNRKGDRYFRPVDIKNLHLIYHLLRQRKYTIEGAKDFLKKSKNAQEKFATIRKLQQVKEFLLELKSGL
ncbi:MAG TPA: MerR family transcriptional regulator [Puia sp.]|jgi:DNA-binding transcriptional MerR regulator|nr:MerR family transcriptional regulator [Puia sp.]